MNKFDFKESIVFENENYILITKPPHFSSLEDRAYNRSSVIQHAKDYWGDAQLCHRLDKETSGIMAIAKTPEAYRHLAMQFEAREVVKVYHAVVGGLRAFNDEIVDQPIFATGNGYVKIDWKKGKDSATIIKTVKAFRAHSLLDCRPLTGRMHQIRIHLAFLNCPIVADKTYGGKDIFLSEVKKKFKLKQDTEEQPLISRVALHAKGLLFHDLDGTEIRCSADYPKDMAALIKQLDNC